MNDYDRDQSISAREQSIFTDAEGCQGGTEHAHSAFPGSIDLS